MRWLWILVTLGVTLIFWACQQNPSASAQSPRTAAASVQSSEIGIVSRFAGEWDLSSILGRYGSFQISVSFGKKIELNGSGRVVFKDSVQLNSPFPTYESVLLDLRFDPAQKKYLLNFEMGGRGITDLPLVFGEGKGFIGVGQMKVGDSTLPVEVEISMRDDGSEWRILAPDKNQPVEKKKDKPLEAYTFDFKKPKPKAGDAGKKQ